MIKRKHHGHTSQSHRSLSSKKSVSLVEGTTNPPASVASLEKVAHRTQPALAVAEPMTSSPLSPFVLADGPLSAYEPVPQRWLWPGRIPLGTLTILDGDLACGKSLLSQQVAAHVSAGTPLPDGSATIKGGVVIIAPLENARQRMIDRLKANGADLERIRVLSFVHDHDAEGATLPDVYRFFQLPTDLEVLRTVMQQIDARLVIIDPVLSVLPTNRHFHQWELQHVLMQLHQMMIELDATCLLIRQCPAKGGEARPSTLERSLPFVTIAASRLLLARDPIEPEHFLLTHVACRLQALAPTISFSMATSPETPHLPRITCQGQHPLRANDLLTHRPAALPGLLLGQRICALLAESFEPVSLDTLREHVPRSLSSHLQRTLRRLLQEKALICPARGLYTLAPTETASSMYKFASS